MFISLKRMIAGVTLACGLSMAAALPAAATDLSFYFPVAVGGPITKLIDGYVAEFQKAHPDIRISPVYAGSYQDTLAKALTALKGGDAPQVAILLSTDMFTLIDEDAVLPFEQLAKSDADKAWLNAFYPAFMENSRAGGHVWGVPFQRSTVVQYWNKEAFKEAGLDPEKPPQTWDELVAFGHRLTKRDAGGAVTQWGVQIPSSGFPYWLFQCLAIENGVVLANEAGDKTDYANPKAIESLQFWHDLSARERIHPSGVVEWGTTPKDFFERKAAIIWTTTGNLTNIRANAPFAFGVSMLPEKVRRGSPTGGGNFYVFKNASPEQRTAALEFVKFMTSAERAAQWGIDTGYVATRPDAWETPAMKAYVAGFPAAAVARDQLQYSVAELSTHDNQRVTKALNDALQAVLTGAKSPAEALGEAQANAERLLKSYR
ncbi:ABC transporter substrate-binding protein [Telmatospirillum siberiense]|uniref:ABC transporter substrate-binding protein n=1 Tax=Telmatospirillum siberiense TaxID=382514 RepID=A0A2N3PVB9_9PROT|nr:ABC transporter substrate-binding protein [Telmatospirillum siberiense]PKU24346.1 ABC transporter substrate-binding protein [Telmatospirillum siberiense]